MKPLALVSHAGIAAVVAAILVGCGLAETGVAAGTQAASAAEQAKQAKEIEEKIEADIAAAQAANKEAIDAAETAASQ